MGYFVLVKLKYLRLLDRIINWIYIIFTMVQVYLLEDFKRTKLHRVLYVPFITTIDFIIFFRFHFFSYLLIVKW